MTDFFLLTLALIVVVQGATLSTKYAERIAEGFHMSRYLVGFIVVSFVAILPETFIAINAAFQGESSLGIGTLFGSNVIDLTLIFAILAIVAGRRGIRVEASMLRKLRIYPLFLTIPLLLGLDGHFSREEGAALIIIGVIFYYYMFRESVGLSSRSTEIRHHAKNACLFLLSMVILLVGVHYTSYAAVSLANSLGVNPILIGVLIVSFGTTLPELSFSVRAVKHKKDALAIGDMLGSVLADATIVVGIVAMISPVTFSRSVAYVAGGFMVVSSIVLLYFMHTNHRITRREVILLVSIWIVYVLSELAVNTVIM